MKINTEQEFKKILKEESNKIGVMLTDTMLDAFYKYKNLLVSWNEKMNLTAITEDYEVIMKHFVDCLEVVKYIKNTDKVIDVGTGAGFPGIVIAIYFEGNIKITLLDSLNKRLDFLKEIEKEIDLKNIEIVHARAEEKAHDIKYRSSYDVVVSRALANLPTLLEYDIPYLKVGGRGLFLKGDNAKIEVEESKKAMQILNCKLSNVYEYKYKVYEEEYTRNIVEIIKLGEASSKYPRNYGQIKKNPLI